MIVAHSICSLEDIPNRRGRAFQLLPRAADGSLKAFSIFVVRWGSQVFGYVNRCPHDGVNGVALLEEDAAEVEGP